MQSASTHYIYSTDRILLYNNPPPQMQQFTVGQSLLIIEASQLHSNLKHTTLSRTPLDKWSTKQTSTWQHTTFTLYLTTHNIHPLPDVTQLSPSTWQHTTFTLYLTTHNIHPVPDDTQHSQQTQIHAPSGIPTCNPTKQVATPMPETMWPPKSASIAIILQNMSWTKM
jgi:hypothetical protein